MIPIAFKTIKPAKEWAIDGTRGDAPKADNSDFWHAGALALVIVLVSAFGYSVLLP